MEYDEIKKIVGKNLKDARRAKGLTQKKVAEYLHKYQPDYCQYESGKIELDYEKIVLLCRLLDVTPDDLFEGIFEN